MAFQVNVLRSQCCEAAQRLMACKDLNEAELEECARLDDALAEAQRVLKRAVSGVIISRLKRRSRTR